MLWVVQSDLYNEEGYVKLIEALERQNVEHIVIKPIPFTNNFVPADFDSMVADWTTTTEPHIDNDQPIFVCGATTLSRIAKHRGWSPGTLLNENFEFEVWRDEFGADNCLNGDAWVSSVKYADGDVFEDFFKNSDQIFIRPTDDSKAFAGIVMDRDAFTTWQRDISKIEPTDEFLTLHKNTEIVIASAKHILAEYRFFIVNRKIVTGSMYKLGSRVLSNEYVDERVNHFVNGMIDGMGIERWVPADAFVLDVAETPDGFKIIEINNINSAGFYACDVAKFVNAVNTFYEYNDKQYSI